MVRFPEAEARLFRNIYVCKQCKTQRRIPVGKVLVGKGQCKNCGSRKLRAKKKKK